MNVLALVILKTKDATGTKKTEAVAVVEERRTTMRNNNKGLKMYHGQATKDIFAEVPDLSERIISTTMKEIKEAYNEFMQDLLLESLEAY